MNTLYVTVDALRADHVTPEVMPTVHSFFEDSIEFTNCYANGPGTPWSFPGLLSSRYAGATDGFGIPREGDPHPTLAEVLSDVGYRTAGFTDNRFASSEYNYDRGIEAMFDEGAISRIKRLKQILRERLDHDGFLFQSLLRGYHVIDDLLLDIGGKETRFVRSEVLVKRLLSWIDEQKDDWFAWLHPMDVHAPCEAPVDYQQRFLDAPIDRRESQKLARKATHHPEEMTPQDWNRQRKLYKAECAYLDDQIKYLFETLGSDILNETLIVFTADHGEMHGEHGLGGHPQQFWEEIIHVPCAISIPNGSPNRVAEQIALIDLPPTILAALDIDPPSDWDGCSMLPTDDCNALPREHVFVDVGAQLDRSLAGVRRADDWKLVRHGPAGELLFDLSENPSETPTDSRIETHPSVYEELTDRLDRHLDTMERRRKGELTGIDDEEMIEDHLRELGYME